MARDVLHVLKVYLESLHYVLISLYFSLFFAPLFLFLTITSLVFCYFLIVIPQQRHMPHNGWDAKQFVFIVISCKCQNKQINDK